MTFFCALNWKYSRLIEIHHPSSLGQLFINRNISYLTCVCPDLGFMLKQNLPEYEGGKEKGQKSLQNLYAVQDGLGAYLCQPTLTGRFLISSHCHPAHLRRLLSRWPDMRGRLRWKDVERKKKWWREQKGQGKRELRWGRWKRILDSGTCFWYYN